MQQHCRTHCPATPWMIYCMTENTFWSSGLHSAGFWIKSGRKLNSNKRFSEKKVLWKWSRWVFISKHHDAVALRHLKKCCSSNSYIFWLSSAQLVMNRNRLLSYALTRPKEHFNNRSMWVSILRSLFHKITFIYWQILTLVKFGHVNTQTSVSLCRIWCRLMNLFGDNKESTCFIGLALLPK